MFSNMSTEDEQVLVGERLLKMLEDRGMSQADLAYAINKPRSTVNDIVSGRRGLGLRRGKEFAKALNLSEEEFFMQMGLFRHKSDNPKIAELNGIAEALPETGLDDLLEFARHRKHLADKRGEYAAKRKNS